MIKPLFFILVGLSFSACSKLPTSPSQPSNPGQANSDKCGITSCHGLDIQCGADVPEVCTEEYRLGDFCRQYAKCEVVEGSCQLTENPKFTECKSCIEKCEKDNQGIEAFNCEDTCIDKAKGPDYDN